MADDRAQIEISASTRGLDAGLRQAAGKVSRWATGIKGAMKGIGVSAVGSSIGNIVGGLASRGTDFLADQAKSVMTFEESLTRLGIAGSLTADQMDNMRTTARRVGSEIGIGSQAIIEGAQTYVDLTGDIQGAAASMETFSRVSQASGASVSDVAQASAAFKGIGIDLKDMESTFSGLITQGKAGAVSLKDFAGELAGLAPRWAKFNEGTTTGGISQLGAAFQVARQGFGSASEAATGLQATMGALTQNAAKFQAAGVKIFDIDKKSGVKSLRTFEQILTGIENSKLVKDPTLMTKALGSKEAEQTVTMLLKARQSVDGTASAYDKLVAAGLDATSVQRDLATYQQSSSGKMAIAMETLKGSIAEAFTPERIEAFADILERVVGGLSDAANWVGDIKDYLSGNDMENPFVAKAADEDSSFLASMGGSGAMLGERHLKGRGAVAVRAALAEQGSVGARDEIEKESGFDYAKQQISGAGTNAKKTRRAVMAAYIGGAGPGQGTATEEGQRAAGKMYLDKQGVSKAQAEDTRAQIYVEMMAKKMTEAIRDGLAGAKVTTTMDSTKVDSVVSNSQKNMTRP